MGTPSGLHFPRLEGAAEGLAICARQGQRCGRDLEEQRDPRDPSPQSRPWSCFVSPNADSSPG